ncbi:MAG: hypothetical protein H6741_20670 [Alphaproteobacteria bacterium]|nr:hypothetical protein [Alphaproteobacteria bacterium]MCB9795123.1 hypothetical protein [Alphaproteobacteria bacterium]
MPRLSLALLLLTGATACLGFKDGPASSDSGPPVSDDTGTTGGLDNIRALRQGAHGLGDTVTIEGIVLGGQLEIGMFVAERDGEPWSGVWVYAPNDTQALAEGTRVRVTGVYEEYSQEGAGTLTELNLEDSGEISVLDAAVALPAATVLSVAQLADPAQAEPYESMLVELRDVRVTNTDLGYGEWELEGAVIVDDYFFAPAALTQGETFTSVTGVLNFHYGAFKIEPRYPRDLVR